MKKPFTDFYIQVIKNLTIIMESKGLNQLDLAEYAGVSESAVSKYLKFQNALSLDNLSRMASGLGLRVIDIITYPKVLKYDRKDDEPVEAVLQIRLTKDKRDQVMKLVFGDNNIEILNKRANDFSSANPMTSSSARRPRPSSATGPSSSASWRSATARPGRRTIRRRLPGCAKLLPWTLPRRLSLRPFRASQTASKTRQVLPFRRIRIHVTD